MHILYLARWFPFPADNGSRLRTRALLEALAARHTVDLISFTEQPPSAADLADARRICRSAVTVPYTPFAPNALRARAGFFSLQPRSVGATYSTAFAAQLHGALARRPDIVIAGQIDMAPYARQVQGIPCVLEELELGLRVAPRSEHGLRHKLTVWKLRRYVRGLLPHFAACTVVSDAERATLCAMAPGYRGLVAVTPNGVHLRPDPQAIAPDPDTLLYPGAVTFSANLDAVRHFAAEILPRIRAMRPGVRVYVTGRTDGVALGDLPQQVEFTGYLPSVEPLLRTSWAMIAPLRQGGGTRLKILEALAAGTPIVSTSKGAEGLALTPGRDLLIADDPADFAAATLRLLGDADLRATLAANGRIAAAQYDWAQIGPQFCTLVEQVAGAAASPVSTLLAKAAPA